MQKEMSKSMDSAWNNVWKRLFSDKTNLFYDFVSSYDCEHRFDHLPTDDEITAQIPNPCGWGTGMEDSMLNAGPMMDIIVMRYEQTGEAHLRELADKVFEGMQLCATAHGRKGFLARSVSINDRKSCYFNSSRDQYTLFVYGLWRFYHSSLSSYAQKEKAKNLLVDVAKYFETNISSQNNYNALRLDGQPALVCQMDGDIGIHEVMRLAMFYAAAWDVSGEQHWFELYRKHAIPGIEKNLEFKKKQDWWYIELYQMQISMLLLSSLEQDSQLLDKYLKVMEMAAEVAKKQIEKHKKHLKTVNVDFSILPTPWREGNFIIRKNTITNTDKDALFYGYPYFMPEIDKEFDHVLEILRAVGQLGLVVFSIESNQAELEKCKKWFIDISKDLDYNYHATYAPINILHAYWKYVEKTKGANHKNSVTACHMACT